MVFDLEVEHYKQTSIKLLAKRVHLLFFVGKEEQGQQARPRCILTACDNIGFPKLCQTGVGISEPKRKKKVGGQGKQR